MNFNLLNYLMAGLLAAGFTWLSLRIVFKFFPQWGLMDRPHKYGLKRAPIPYYGGLAIFVPFWLTILFLGLFTWQLFGLFLLTSVVLAVSFWDDFRGVSPWLRLIMQLGCGVAIFFLGYSISSISSPFGSPLITASWLSGILVVIWLVLMINTFNWIDGLNGLPSGIGAIASLVIFLLAMRPGLHTIDQTQLAYLSIILFGVLLVFWRYDFYPAKLLMGDTGSMFIGLMLGVMSLMAGGKLATVFLVMGLPILDAFWVIMRRILSGKSPLKGDLKHFHHRLLDLGWGQRKIMLSIYLVSFGFGLSAVFLGTREKMWALIILVLLMAIVGLFVVYKSIDLKQNK